MGGDFRDKGRSKLTEKVLYKTPQQGKSVRPKRVAEVIRQAIGTLLVQGRIEGIPPNVLVSVEDVDVSPDLGQAVVYVSWFETSTVSQEAQIMSALHLAEPMARSFLAHELVLRRVPRVIFKYAGTKERVESVEALFRSDKVQKDIKE